ncbi:hypothetical protein JCM5353_004433 [Sporobolomyces roseus]
MDVVPHSSAKIDRLSSLPPELLHSIFDLAYDPDHIPLKPLSKTLLPYYRRNLYRQIRLSSRSSWSKLLKTVKASPALGELVLDLDTSAAYVFPKQGQVEEIVNSFPRLNSLKTGYIQPLRCTPTDSVHPSLQHLSYECDVLDIAAFDFLANLNLSTLEINFHSTHVLTQPSPLPRLESLNKLSLVSNVDDDTLEEPIWEPSLINIIDCCPNITSLRLFDTIYPDYRDVLSKLPHLAHQITSLELDSPRLAEAYDSFVSDALLPQFSNLIHLSLGDGTVSISLPSRLRQLPQLASLRLGPDTHLALNATDLLSLLEGPTRLLPLRHLTFDCFGGKIGRRIKVGDAVIGEVTAGMRADGWERPMLDHGIDAILDERDTWEIVQACSASGIELNGDHVGALTIKEDYDLEFANRSVLRSLQIKTLDGLKHRAGLPHFSHIPIDNLDPQNLKLVKTGIPEKNWFRLSLE